MTQLEKLIARIKRRPPLAEFNDVQRLLEAYGWTLDRESGSHAQFTKAGERPITVPKVHGRKVKRTYLDHLCDRLGLD